MTFSISPAWLVAWLFPTLAHGQLTLRGQVRNGQDQTPLPFATVFLANTTKGVTTNEQGQFVLTDVPVGKYELVVSYVGFHPIRQTVQTGEATFYRIELRPDEKQLAGVTVKARSRRGPEWARNVEFFKKYFIGNSANAGQCQLLNPEALYFENTAEAFVARADEPLVVENRGLGYRVKFLLRDYTYDQEQHVVRYNSDAVFEPLTGSPRDVQRWAEARRAAYFGSAMHFMRALYRKQLAAEGFAVQRVRELPRRTAALRLVGLPGDTTLRVPSLAGKHDVSFQSLREKHLLDTLRSTPDQPVVAFTGTMQVTYTRERESLAYQKTRPLVEHGHNIRPQTTLLRMTQPSVVVEPDGHFYDPQGIRYQGYWSWELVAEELPLDYEP